MKLRYRQGLVCTLAAVLGLLISSAAQAGNIFVTVNGPNVTFGGTAGEYSSSGATAQAQNGQNVTKTQDTTPQDLKVKNALALIEKVKVEPKTVHVTDLGTTRNYAEAEQNVYNNGSTHSSPDQEGIATFQTGKERSARDYVTLRVWWYPSMHDSVWNIDQTGSTRNNLVFSISGPVGDKYVTITGVRNSDHINYDEGVAPGLSPGLLRDDVTGGIRHVGNIFRRSKSQSGESSNPPAVKGRQIYDHQVVDAFYNQFEYY